MKKPQWLTDLDGYNRSLGFITKRESLNEQAKTIISKTKKKIWYVRKKRYKIKNYFNARKCFCDLVKKGEFPPTETEYEKNYYHAYTFRKNLAIFQKEFLLQELIRLQTIILKNEIPYSKRRKKKHGCSSGLCEVCKEKKSYCMHHIISIKNGGYDTKINRISICHDCHSQIHPWLKTMKKENKELDKDCLERFSLNNT